MYRHLKSLLILLLLLAAAGCNLKQTTAPTSIPTDAAVVNTVSPSLASSPAPTLTLTPAATLTTALTPTLSETAADIDAYLGSLVVTNDFSGSVLVALEGQVLLSKGYGLADWEGNLPNSAETLFKIGSISKQFTAVAILMLQDRGLLTVADPICNFIPDCPTAWAGITLHHLLTLTSGIRDYFYLPEFESLKNQPITALQLIGHIKDKPLLYTPGYTWDYSNSNYLLLGHVIEQVSGLPYGVFLQVNIFDPLQMTSSGYDSTLVTLAIGYTGMGDEWTVMDSTDPSVSFAAGALYSTVEDLYLWDRALYSGQLLPPDLLTLMFTPHASGRLGDYGYGWLVATRYGQQVVWHPGGIDGFKANLERFTDQEAVIILLSNRDTTDVRGITDVIAQMVLGE